MTRARPSWGTLVAVAAVVVALDQATKSWALAALRDRPPVHVVWTLHLDLAFNSGAAFSLFRGAGAGVVPVAVAVVIGVLLLTRTLPGRLPAAVVGAVVGGAVGNLVDRLARDHDGAVVDFFDLRWWPVFNVADVFIVCGAIALALLSLRSDGPAPAPADPGPDRVAA